MDGQAAPEQAPEQAPERAWEQDRAHLVHPFADFATFAEEGSHIITRSEGMHVIDGRGRRLLDGIAGLWCVNIGHGRREMADAIGRQALEMAYYNPFGPSSNVPASALGAKLATLAPGDLNRVYYTTGGSTANDAAVRIVHYHFDMLGMPRKKKIISRLNAYHGATYVAASLTGIHATKTGFDRIGEGIIHHVSAADMSAKPEDWSEERYCDHLVREFEDRVAQLGPDNVAAFIAEPLMGAGGVLVAPRGYHARMAEVCRRHGMLYVADEVITAFGRLGAWFASEDVYGHQPDIITCAKGITSGYVPLGAVLISERVHEVIARPQAEGATFSMGVTYWGHPVACAAALTNIAIMEREALPARARRVGAHLQEAALALTNVAGVGQVHGAGLMVGIDLVSDRARTPAGPAAARRVFEACVARGAIVRPVGSRIILSPPLIIDEAQCDELLDAVRGAVTEVMAA